MAHRTDTDAAVSAVDDPRNSQELAQSIYNHLDISPPQHEKHSAIIHCIRRFYEQKRSAADSSRPVRRPRSLSSNPSSLSSARSSRTSSHFSLASSRTSHCSGHSYTPQASGQISATAANTGNASADYTPPLSSIGNEASSPAALAKLRCPWCNTSIKKPHDFKRHVNAYCCGRRVWVCLNPDCTHATYQRKQARDHCHHYGGPLCKQKGWKTIDLDCDRKHFGCAYCATYFSNLDAFLHHLIKDCGPKHSDDRGHQSSQIIALLQQPSLRPLVESLSLELRHSRNAYLRLHWTWSKQYMAGLIEQLEYGVKTRVDQRHPGIAVDQVDDFVRLLITPSRRSEDVVKFATEHAKATALRRSAWKALPPLPEAVIVTDIDMQEHQQQIEPNELALRNSEEDALDADPTDDPVASPPAVATYRPDDANHSESGISAVSQYPYLPQHDTSTTDFYDLVNDDSNFTWQHFSDTICADLMVDCTGLGAAQSWSFTADQYCHFASDDIVSESTVPMQVDETSILQQATATTEASTIVDPSLL